MPAVILLIIINRKQAFRVCSGQATNDPAPRPQCRPLSSWRGLPQLLPATALAGNSCDAWVPVRPKVANLCRQARPVTAGTLRETQALESPRSPQRSEPAVPAVDAGDRGPLQLPQQDLQSAGVLTCLLTCALLRYPPTAPPPCACPRSQRGRRRAAPTDLGGFDDLGEVVHDGLDVVLESFVVRLQQGLLALRQGSLLGHGWALSSAGATRPRLR